MEVTAPPTPVTSMTLREYVEQLIKTAERPIGVKEMKPLLKERGVPIGGKSGFSDAHIEAAVHEEVAAGAAFAHPPATAKGKPAFWHSRPKTTAEKVSEAVRANAASIGDDELVTDKQLGKPSGKAAMPDAIRAFEEVLASLLNAGELHRHGTKFGRRKPPTVAEQVAKGVRDKVAALKEDEVVSEAKLGKPGGKASTPEAKRAFEETLNSLLSEKRLFRHGKNFGKRAPEPPKWYDTEPAKKAFASLVNAAKKVVGVHASADEVFAVLRQRLESTAPAVAEKPKPPAPPTPVSPPPVPPGADLRAVLRQAYDHLCLFVEFRDKLVELPRLYHEAAKRSPGLTVEAFHRELWQLSEERQIQLHVLNEVREAKEPHLALRRNDRFYYFARWN